MSSILALHWNFLRLALPSSKKGLMQFNKLRVSLSCIFGKVVVLVENKDRLISVLSKFKKVILLSSIL